VLIRPPAVIPLSGRVPGRAFGPSRSRIDDSGGLKYVSRNIDRVFRFSHRGEYIGGRAASGKMDQGLTPAPGAAWGWPAPWGGVATSWLPSVSALDSVTLWEK
jgi:hypothetical protein